MFEFLKDVWAIVEPYRFQIGLAMQIWAMLLVLVASGVWGFLVGLGTGNLARFLWPLFAWLGTALFGEYLVFQTLQQNGLSFVVQFTAGLLFVILLMAVFIAGHEPGRRISKRARNWADGTLTPGA